MIYKKIVNDVYARKLKTGWIEPILFGEVEKEGEIKFLFDLAQKVICDKQGGDMPIQDICFEDEFPCVRDYLLNVINSLNQKKS